MRGRTDKKFCDDYCRSAYNNKRLNGNDNAHIRSINNILRSNRRILQEILPESIDKVQTIRETLVGRGFQFKYFTHVQQSNDGKQLYCCYEYGYNSLDQDELLIVRQE